MIIHYNLQNCVNVKYKLFFTFLCITTPTSKGVRECVLWHAKPHIEASLITG